MAFNISKILGRVTPKRDRKRSSFPVVVVSWHDKSTGQSTARVFGDWDEAYLEWHRQKFDEENRDVGITHCAVHVEVGSGGEVEAGKPEYAESVVE